MTIIIGCLHLQIGTLEWIAPEVIRAAKFFNARLKVHFIVKTWAQVDIHLGQRDSHSFQ